jgi:hypothetical protein
MAWFNRNAPSAKGQNAQRSVVKHTFDVPVKVRVRSMSEPLQATVLHLAVANCRMRSWMSLERGTAVAFDWQLSDGRILHLSGAVAARYPASSGVGFEHAIALEELPVADADALARDLATLSRRTAAARNFDTSVVDVSHFTGYRVADDFPIAYRSEGARTTASVGRACDVMGGGLRMRCEHRLRSGDILSLQFTLPARSNARRQHPQLSVKAKVLGTVKDSRRRDAYELQFLDTDGTLRVELARYIHAAQQQQ